MKNKTMVVLFLSVFALMGIGFSLLAVAGSTRLTPSGIQFPDTTAQSTAWISSGNDIFYTNGKVGIGAVPPDTQLHVYGSGNVVTVGDTSSGLILQAIGGASSVIGWGATGDTGSPGYNDLALRANAEPTGVYIKKSGKVGIGTKNPEAALDVNGDLKVSGNMSFPPPAYDSGWVNIATGAYVTLTHNVGGSANNYVVDLTFNDTAYGNGIHIQSHGLDQGEYYDPGVYGVYWRNLTNSTITLERGNADHISGQSRVRIWRYE